MLGKLIPCGGGAPVPLLKSTLLVGRHPVCDLAIPCQTVSGKHCELQFSEGFWWVRDLGSKNGTSVNGVKGEKQRVAPNDVVAIGRNRFVLAYQPAEKQRPPAVIEDVEAAALAFLIGHDQLDAAPPAKTPAPPLWPAKLSRKPTGPALGQLTPCGGGVPIELLMPELLVGRSPRCDICLPYPAVSAKHCKMTWQDTWWFVEDLKSSNGTWVNGARCQKKCVVPEAVVSFAMHRYAIHYLATSSAPPPDEDDVFSQGLLEKLGLEKKLGAAAGHAKAEDEADSDRKPYNLDLDGDEP